MEFVNGQSLTKYIKNSLVHKLYHMNSCLFYISNILLMLDYLQKNQIAHRDIKPDNIMIDSNGYLKMVDFGTAKIITNYTSSVVGTPYFMAPEVLRGEGYSFSCDYWSSGVCLYQMYYDSFPFGSRANSILDVYKSILNEELKFRNITSNPAETTAMNELISSLLTKNSDERLCDLNKIKELSAFAKFNWDNIHDFKAKPPYIPPTFPVPTVLPQETEFETIINQSVDTWERKKTLGNIKINQEWDN